MAHVSNALQGFSLSDTFTPCVQTISGGGKCAQPINDGLETHGLGINVSVSPINAPLFCENIAIEDSDAVISVHCTGIEKIHDNDETHTVSQQLIVNQKSQIRFKSSNMNDTCHSL